MLWADGFHEDAGFDSNREAAERMAKP